MDGGAGPNRGDLMVNVIGKESARRSAIIRTNVDLCKVIIRGSPRRQPPDLTGKPLGATIVGDDEVGIDLWTIQQSLEAVYDEIEQQEFGRHAFRLLHPYFLDEIFGKAFVNATTQQTETVVQSLVATVDLFLEAHELSLPDSSLPSGLVEIKPGMTLLDVLEKRDEYPPVTHNQSFFIFGKRVDHGYRLQSYQQAMGQLARNGGESEEVMERLLARRTVLDLVLCVIDHLCDD